MTTQDVQQWLSAGIAAAKRGERDGARALLLQVVEADEENELGWLWLSGVVESTADRRVCLENVLALNPDHALARRGLARLDAQETAVSPPSPIDEQIVRREYAPISPAAAMLYPERQVQEWHYRDPTTIRQAPAVETAAVSSYDDVWSRGEDLCAYCAAALPAELTQCPGCGRQLETRQFRYPEPSVNLHVLWVMLTAVGQLLLIQGLFLLIVERVLIGAVISGVLMLLFFGLALGVYLRRWVVYIAAIGMLGLLLLAALLDALLPVDYTDLGGRLSAVDPAIANFLGGMAESLGAFIQVFLLLTVVVALFFAIFRAAPDFQRVRGRQTAQLKRGLQFASEYDQAARAAARRGMWATAVLHWQRAVAKAPHKAGYLRQLGMAYARLGFTARSLDVLETAVQFSPQPEQQAALRQLITAVRTRQAGAPADIAGAPADIAGAPADIATGDA
ncbi:MAG: hypothetical protein KC425_20865 [Anaerolineales bacterium]|nr:hypothetical protein [Anaerolineales bacterium]